MCGPAIIMARVVRLFVCHTRISPKLSLIGIWLLSDLQSKVRFRHFGCFRVGMSPIQAEVDGWPCECSERITGNSHQSAPHWAPRRASYRHVPQRTIPCYSQYILAVRSVGRNSWRGCFYFSLLSSSFFSLPSHPLLFSCLYPLSLVVWSVRRSEGVL